MLKTVSKLVDASQIKTPITLPGDVTLSTGNLVIGTSGKGIDFSATPGTGTSELFSDYEEGVFTPTLTSAAGVCTLTASSGTYTKIGRMVYFRSSVTFTTDASVGTSNLTIGGLPFTVAGTAAGALTLSSFSEGDLGTGGANGFVRVLFNTTNFTHIQRSVSISSRSSAFSWGYVGLYQAS
jgi:hypothetical protein